MDGDEARRKALRGLPSVDELMELEPAKEACDRLSRRLVVKAAREAIERARRDILNAFGSESAAKSGQELSNSDGSSKAVLDDSHDGNWPTRLADALARVERRLFQPVINATGVVLHTNLGRAPLGEASIEAVVRASQGYTNLEYDLERGQRGSRHVHGEELLVELTGAEAAMVVNNNAAAVLLVLSALASGKEVVLSRGELIEIGGAFRIPDVLAQSGCRLIEVGTTNRTHIRDYEAALGPDTAAILKVHPSNYRVVGFTRSASVKELAPLARSHGVLLIEDLGSGVLLRTEKYGLKHEPTVQESLASGADIVTCSGDKLFGGPQAGIILGRKDLVDRCRNHPLARALRVDKMTLAAMQATLMEYAKGTPENVPIWRMMGTPLEDLRNRAERLVARVQSESAGSYPIQAIEARKTEAAVGGGSLPEETLPTWAVALTCGSPQRLATLLRQHTPAIVGRIESDSLLIDLRTIQPDEDDVVAQALISRVALQ